MPCLACRGTRSHTYALLKPPAREGRLVGVNKDQQRRYSLRHQALVPLPLPPEHVAQVVRLVSAARTASATDPDDALRFAAAAREGRCLVLQQGTRRVLVEPLQLVLHGDGRWLGVARRHDQPSVVRTYRLGQRWGAHDSDVPRAEPPTAQVDVALLLHPLTWGDVTPSSVLVSVSSAALPLAQELLGPAVQAMTPRGDRVELVLETTDPRMLLGRLARLRTTLQVLDPSWHARLVQHLRAVLDVTVEALAGDGIDAAADVSTPEPQPDHHATAPSQVVLDPAAPPPAGTRSEAAVRIRMLTDALDLLASVPSWDAANLARRLDTTVSTLASVLTTYVAAESDIANILSARSAGFAPLVREHDARGRLERVSVEPGGEGPHSLGRHAVPLDVLVTACLEALRRLGSAHGQPEPALQSFLAVAADALGFSTTATRQDDGSLVDALEKAVNRAASVPRPFPAEQRVEHEPSGRPVYRFTYVHPWTGERSVRRVVPLAVRQGGSRSWLDALDVQLAADHPSPLQHTRSFLVAGITDLEEDGAHYPLDLSHFPLFRSHAQQDTLVTLRAHPSVHHDLEEGWGAAHVANGESGVVLHPPAEERAFDLVVEHAGQLRLCGPHWVVDAVRAKVLAHHG